MTAVSTCDSCGVNLDTIADLISEKNAELARKDETIANLNGELNSKLGQIKRLKRDQDRALRDSPQYEDAAHVLKEWKRLCHPDAKELSGIRLERVIARLKGGFGPDDLIRCAEGYSLKPFVINGGRSHDGPRDAWRADAELIYRDARHVDYGIRIAEQADRLRQSMRPQALLDEEKPGRESEVVEAVLSLAEADLAVFPCRPDGKAPACLHGLSDAKTDVHAIRRCWSARPDFNVAVATGARSGVVVLDVDDRQGGLEAFRRLERDHSLPRTRSVKTPNGGTHYWFVHPGVEIRNTTDFPAPGLDVRGDGGYVLVPPSQVDGRPYVIDEEAPPAPMPQWLTAMLVQYQRKADMELKGTVDWAKRVNDGATQGQRNNAMTSYVGHLFAHGHNAREVYALVKVLNTNVRPPLPDKDLLTIVKSIARRHAR